jgi:pyruvate dehydrogenase E1 component
VALGTDGFGRSDTRRNLRSFFGVDAAAIVAAARASL